MTNKIALRQLKVLANIDRIEREKINFKRNIQLEKDFKAYFIEFEFKDWQGAKELLRELQKIDEQ